VVLSLRTVGITGVNAVRNLAVVSTEPRRTIQVYGLLLEQFG